MRLRTSVLALGVGVLMSTVAVAEQDGRAKGFEAMDVDDNGEVSFEEFRDHSLKRIERHFERIDADGNGVLSEAELHEARARHKGRKKRKQADQ